MNTKTCSKCKIDKPLEEFNKKGLKRDGSIKLQPYCKQCNSIKCQEYYRHNKKKLIQQTKKLKHQRKVVTRYKLLEYLTQNGCIDCGEKDPMVLDFDHISHKEHDISRMIQDGYSWNSILIEINKCEIRCANCHRRKTAKEQGWYKAA